MRGLTDRVIVRTAAQLAGGAFAAEDLARCTLWLLGPLAALRLARLRDCRVYSGPVAGATFADGMPLPWLAAAYSSACRPSQEP